jgi:phosphoribosylaminoimidazole-succinocarboxamide synthase
VLELRTLICRKARVLPVECIVRGYISGSGWKEYKKYGSICGIELPKHLQESDRLPEPIFTPSTKAEIGHDENINFEKTVEIIGKETALFIKEKSIQLYKKAKDYAEEKGIIIADTKFEFGIEEKTNKIILIDEILTPDSSRFWPKSKYERGKSQPSFDKQFVRDYLESIDWDKNPPAPELPEEIINITSKKYLEIYYLLTGIKIG